MKKLTLKTNALLAVLLGTAVLSTAQVKLTPVGRQNHEIRATADDTDEKVLLEEDFSKFTAGTEEEPDTKNISDNITAEIPSRYTQAPGWMGGAVRQAGGVCYLALGKYATNDDGTEYGTKPGYLITPTGDYAGDLTVTFRARLFEAETDQLTVSLIHKDKGYLEESTMEVGKTWKDYTVNFSKGDFTLCAIQFATESTAVLLDDIKVTSIPTSIIAPAPLAATDFTADGFTANWAPTEEAESYLLSVYEAHIDGATVTETFDGIKATADGMVDETAPNLPEGWEIVLAQGDGIQLTQDGFNGSQAIVLDETNDWIQTPYSEKPLMDVKFYAKNISGVSKNASSLQIIVMQEQDKWYELGRIDLERISTAGELISIADNLTDQDIHQVGIVFEKGENDADKDPMVAIDQLSYMIQPEFTPVFEDKELTETSYKVSELKSDVDYCYTVKAKNSQFTSAASPAMMALGLLTPVLEEATGISDNGYTAHWQPVAKADGYYVRNYRIHTVADGEEETILHEDFSNATEGTPEAPNYLYNFGFFQPTSLDEYTSTPGWYGKINATIAGMLGGDVGAGTGTGGQIQTPAMKLDGNGGKFKVTVTAYGGEGNQGDSLVVQAGNSVYKRIYLPDAFTTPVTETLEFDCGEADMALLFYTYQGSRFFIDEITVTQELEIGTQIITEEANGYSWGNDNTSYTFEGLEQGENEEFGFRVYAYRLFCEQEVYSQSGETALVDLNAPNGIDMNESNISIFAAGQKLHVNLPEALHVSVYDLNGRTCLETEAVAGTNVFHISQPGVYMVKAGGYVSKVVIP